MPTTRANHTKITKLPVFNDDRDLVKFLETSFAETAKQYIKALVTTMVKAEMEDVRQKAGQDMPFNGYYPRQLVSPFGRVEDVPVPRFREAPDGLSLKSMQLFEAEQQRTMALLADMHLHLRNSARRLPRRATRLKDLVPSFLTPKVQLATPVRAAGVRVHAVGTSQSASRQLPELSSRGPGTERDELHSRRVSDSGSAVGHTRPSGC